MLNTLFDIGPVLPGGFNYYPGFIPEDEETFLVNSIQQYDLKNMQFHEYEAKRKVMSFGQGWSFTEQRLNRGSPFPLNLISCLKTLAQNFP